MLNLVAALRVCACLLALLWLNSCSTPETGGLPGTELPAASADGLNIHILPDTYIDGGSFDSLSLLPDGSGGFDVQVYGARALKALYFYANYDSTRLGFTSADPTAAWGDPNNYLQIDLAGQPGYAEFGLILIHPEEQAGFTGSAVLAHLRFAQL